MKHKKQHWLPISYLSAWIDPAVPKNQEGYIWIFSKNGDEVKNRSPKNIFFEKDMYTNYNQNGERNLQIEKSLSTMEDAFCKIRDKKLALRKALTQDEYFKLITFMAAMHARTQSKRDHWKKNFQKVVDVGDKIRTAIDGVPPAERPNLISTLSSPGTSTSDSISLEEMRKLAKNPLQNIMGSMIKSQVEIFIKMSFVILYTNLEPGFITSDKPCINFDPNWYKYPPAYQAPALGSSTIEVTFPVSPFQLILLTWYAELDGYVDISEIDIIDDFNQRTRALCDKNFIVRKKIKKDIWFKVGEPEK